MLKEDGELQVILFLLVLAAIIILVYKLVGII